MMGPGIASYLVVSVVLFGIGAFGVLIRRSPLIVLLALEIMLNAGNLALLAVARHLGDGSGQIFAPTVMVVAALTLLDTVAITRYVPSIPGVPVIKPVALSIAVPGGSPLAV